MADRSHIPLSPDGMAHLAEVLGVRPESLRLDPQTGRLESSEFQHAYEEDDEVGQNVSPVE